MKRVAEVYQRIINEYKSYEIDNLRIELHDELIREMNTINRKQETYIGETTKKVDGYERLHNEHKRLQKDNNDSLGKRMMAFENIKEENKVFDRFEKGADRERAELRDEFANKENPLHQIQHKVAVLGLESKKLQLVIDTGAALRVSKAAIEKNAVKIVNNDLKDHINSIEVDINNEKSEKIEAK